MGGCITHVDTEEIWYSEVGILRASGVGILSTLPSPLYTQSLPSPLFGQLQNLGRIHLRRGRRSLLLAEQRCIVIEKKYELRHRSRLCTVNA